MRRFVLLLIVVVFALLCPSSLGATLDIRDFGANATTDASFAVPNRDAFVKALAAAEPGDHVVIPSGLSFVMLGVFFVLPPSLLFLVTSHLSGGCCS